MKAEGCEFISKCKIEITDDFYLVKVFEYITRQTKMKCRIQNKMYWIYTKLCEKIILRCSLYLINRKQVSKEKVKIWIRRKRIKMNIWHFIYAKLMFQKSRSNIRPSKTCFVVSRFKQISVNLLVELSLLRNIFS